MYQLIGNFNIPTGNPRAFDILKLPVLFRGKEGRKGRKRGEENSPGSLWIRLRGYSRYKKLSRWVDFIKEKVVIFHTNMYIDRSYVVCLSRKLNLGRLCFLINFFWLRIFRDTVPYCRGRGSLNLNPTFPAFPWYFLSQSSPESYFNNGGDGTLSKNNWLRVEHKTCVFWNSGPLYCGKYDGCMSKQDCRCWWWRQGNWIRSYCKAVRFSLEPFGCICFTQFFRFYLFIICHWHKLIYNIIWRYFLRRNIVLM